jgi:hypothetical protein
LFSLSIGVINAYLFFQEYIEHFPFSQLQGWIGIEADGNRFKGIQIQKLLEKEKPKNDSDDEDEDDSDEAHKNVRLHLTNY